VKLRFPNLKDIVYLTCYLKVVKEKVTKAALSNSVLHSSDSHSMGKIEIDKYGLQQYFSMKSSRVLLKGSVSSVGRAWRNTKLVVFRFS